MTTEAQIHADIEAIREKIPETQDLYREVCTILFFRYGITPTANKLYQYVRKGSMSAPAEALVKFWEDLREKSRVRIEHPDLPEAVKTAAGDLVASLWTQAQAAAQETLTAFRAEAQTVVLEAKTVKAAAETERDAALAQLNQAQQTIQAATERALQMERELAIEQAGKESLTAQLAAALRQHTSLENALAEARRDFADELEKLRQALQKSEERHEAGEKRALLEIDRERMNAAKVQKEMAQLRESQMEVAERHRNQIDLLQKELGAARQNAGVAEGTLQEMRAIYQQQTEQLQSLRTALSEGEAQRTVLEHDLMASREKVAILEKELQQLGSVPKVLAETAKPPRKSRKKVAD
ncbi:MAG: exopolysaccharide biosynthesis protein [Rhodocyclaceae bacterium]|nr:MAG: exopolysaccharide biosynthesis protein [Rhodocyclaceae bacterium]